MDIKQKITCWLKLVNDSSFGVLMGFARRQETTAALLLSVWYKPEKKMQRFLFFCKQLDGYRLDMSWELRDI